MKLLLGGFLGCVLAVGVQAQSNVTVVYPPPAQTPPIVVFVREHPAPVLAPVGFPEEYGSERPVTYQIAFKNSAIRVADQYWVNGKTLFFVTLDHRRMSAPVDSVDRALSRRLNSEQNVAFFLPAQSVRTNARTSLVRHTATVSVVHKRCYCTVK